MYYYRVILADGVMYYINGDSAADVRKKFARRFPMLPAVSSVKRLCRAG